MQYQMSDDYAARVDRVVEMLDTLVVDDPEQARDAADDLLLSVVPGEVFSAYCRAMQRIHGRKR